MTLHNGGTFPLSIMPKKYFTIIFVKLQLFSYAKIVPSMEIQKKKSAEMPYSEEKK